MDFGVKMDTSSGPPAGSAGGGSTAAPLQGFTDKDVQGGVWTGMTIKDILEKVDLFNITTEDEPSEGKDVKPNIKNSFTKPAVSEYGEKKKVVVSSNPKPESAFLGPKIWKNPITLPMLAGGNNGSGDAEFSIMNIDDFLSENNFDFSGITPPLPDDEILGLSKEKETRAMQAVQHQDQVTRKPHVMMSPGSISSDDSMDLAERYKPPPSIAGSVASQQSSQDIGGARVKNALPKGENGFLYAESKRAKMERERAEARKRKMEIPIEFAAEDLALATIPGADFDPKRRHFSADELRPQPIIRKRKKTYVNGEDKDDKYWERREKNNMAARRSREARRLKENQIALRTAYLEKENGALQVALDKSSAENEQLKEENKRLKEALDSYENGLLSLN